MLKSDRESDGVRTLPRGLIYLIDISIVLFCLAFSRLLRHNFRFEKTLESVTFVYGSALVINSILFYFFRTYYGIVRYTTVRDSFRIITLNLLASVAYIIVKLASSRYGEMVDGKPIEYLSWVSIFINFFVVTVALIGYKTVVRYAYKAYFLGVIHKDKIKVAIYDAEEEGLSAKRALTDNTYSNLKVVCFLDDNPNKRNKTIERIPIFSTEESTYRKLKEEEIQLILIAKENISHAKLNEIVDAALIQGIRVQQIPPLDKWLHGKLVSEQIKDVKIEDLLERDVIEINNESVFNEIKNKKVVVTGAAGSIGSEIVRQLLKLKPAMVILCDKAESPLHELQLEVEERYGAKQVKTFIGDICDPLRMEQLFEVYSPEIVFHAAAYKHVPMMESNPSVAVINNVFGTKLLADLSVANHVEKFVMVSTDKAVNPTNVMGASKRIAEIFIQSYNRHQESFQKEDTTAKATKFITTRFGNVLGSNGSVIPRFKKQIEKGGPITITHPEITRYFMTIPEACQLVIEAGVMGTGGEIFVFDMGQPVKIVDLARKMILLSGRTPEVDIKTVFTGLRPGEKLYEELLNNAENTLPTYHEKIMIAQVREYDFVWVESQIKKLVDCARKHYTYDTVSKMKELVPEYISNNSAFESLDAVPAAKK